ncbi:MAG: hypothetical protein Q8R76_10305 [Candidatus Omnitrophota bacterium]|nr:hypothetical protein [Candidatus Omnitrophota bacterium]
MKIVKKRFRVARLNLKTDAGGIKVLLDGEPQVRNWIVKNIKLACDLHQTTTIVLVNH